MKKHTLSLFALVSILALIGGCAPTASVQKQANIVDSASISYSAPNDYQNPSLQDIGALSDKEKLFNAKNLSITGNKETSNKFLFSINSQNLSNKHFIDYTLLAAENHMALFQMRQAETLINHTRFKTLFSRQSKEIK